MQSLYFVRHGESQDNAAGIWSRWDTMLTDKGRMQARQAGRGAKAQNLQFNLIVASTMPRARESARLLAEELVYPLEAIEYLDILIERNFGTLSGTHSDAFFDGSRTYEDVDKLPSAETIAALQLRAAKALEHLRQRPEQNILIVGHGTFARAMRRVINNEPPENEYAPNRQDRQLSHAAIVQFI